VSHDAPPRPPGLTRVDDRWFQREGEPVDTDTLARLIRLAIPPAWTHVWADPDPDPDAALQGRRRGRQGPQPVPLPPEDRR
jgi:hypothetical protein